MTIDKVTREVTDLDTLSFIMRLLVDVRESASRRWRWRSTPSWTSTACSRAIFPVGFMEKEEINKKTVLRTNWKKLLNQCESRTEELSKTRLWIV